MSNDLPRSLSRRSLLLGAAATGGLALSGCGGNLGGGSGDAASFPSGPVTMLIGGSPGGIADLELRALADPVSADLDVSTPVENRPGANGALAAGEVAQATPDGQTIMIFNGSLAYITPLAVSADEAVSIDDYEVVTGVCRDDYVIVTSPGSGFASIDDLTGAGRPITYATTGVGTGSQLSQAYVLALSGLEGTPVPFDGGNPTMVAVLGGQTDIGCAQIGDALAQIQAGQLVPLLVMAAERNPALPEVPTATESGLDAVVQQSRAIVAPKDTPADVVARLREAFRAAFEDPAYREFQQSNQLIPWEVDGDEVVTDWNDRREEYAAFVEESGVSIGEG